MSRRRKKVNKLSDISIDEVSLVDRGANQHAKVLLSKRDGDEEDDVDELEKNDPDPSDVALESDEGEGNDEEKDESGFFANLVDKLFEGESTTDDDELGNITDMSDVEKNNPNDPRSMQLPYGQQPMGQPAPGPQNAMPPGAQAFPGQQQPMPGQMPGQPQMPGQMPGQQMPGQMQAGPPLPDEVVQYIQQLEQALSQAQGGGNQMSGQQEDKDVNTNNPFGKSVDGLDDDEVTFLQELSKNLEDEETRDAVNKAVQLVESAQERAEEAETIAKRERDIRLAREYVEKASGYRHLPVNPEEFGQVLKAIDESLDEEQRELLEKALKAADETVANAGVFDEIGKRGAAGYEPISKAEARAEEIRKESDGEMTKEEALAKVYEEDPSLYDEYTTEKGL